MAHEMNEAMQECIDRCQTCDSVCLETVAHCLALGGRHAEAGHIQTLLACGEICHTSARFMLLGSAFHARSCEICADVCDACADDCNRFPDDESMQRCADTCLRCAESCREMARSMSRT